MTRRTNAGIAGFTLLFYIAVGVTQMILSAGASGEGTAARLAFMARHAWRVQLNVVLTLVICLTALALAVSLYGITRDQDRDLALLAFTCRVMEAVFGAIAPPVALGLLWLATEGAAEGTATNVLGSLLLRTRAWSIQTSATLFAAGSTLFSWLFLRGRMIPAPLAWLGVVASVLLLFALPLQLTGLLSGPVTQIIWLPMAAYEVPLGVWLLVKGVGPRALE